MLCSPIRLQPVLHSAVKKETACALTHVCPHRHKPRAPTLAQHSMFSLYMSCADPTLQLSARVSDYHFIVAMSLLDSKSEFDSRAQQVGLVEEVVQALSDKGIASLAQLGFAAGTPGTTDETSLRAWASETLGSLSVPLGQEIALRRLLFTAHTLIIASLKEEVARDLTRHQEPSYELVDAFSAMLEARSVR